MNATQEINQKIFLVGVTGTNGKSTITYLLKSLWPSATSGIIGTIGIKIGEKDFPTTHTTPDAKALTKIFADMAAANIDTIAIEVSSHALVQNRVVDCEFDVAIFTNLTQDHLDYHKDMESYYQAKKKFFSDVLARSQKTKKCAVINIDDFYGERLTQEVSGFPVKTFSLNKKTANLFLVKAELDLNGMTLEFSLNGESLSLRTNLIGRHNIQNIMATVLVAAHQGLSKNKITSAFENVTVPGRLERVADKNYFVDYAHTPDALQHALKTLSELGANGRLITVFGCGGDRDKGKRPLMGEVAAKLADVTMITSDNPRTEDPQVIVNEILAGVSPHQKSFDGNSGYLVEVDRKKALEKITQMANPNDIVLVAGKGHEDYQIVGTTKIHFDDREILRDLLK